MIQAFKLYIQKLQLFSYNARLVLVYSAIGGLTRGVYQLLLNFYVLSLGDYDETFLGILPGAQSLAMLVAAIPVAYIAERFSQRRIMILGALGGALSYLGIVLLPSPFFLIFFSVMLGLAGSIRNIIVPPFLMRNTTEEERQYVFSFNFGGRTIARFGASMIGGFLPTWLGGLAGAAPTDTLAYQLALVAIMVVEMISMLPAGLLRMPSVPRSKSAQTPWAQLWQYRDLLARLAAPSLIIGLGAGLMMPFRNLYFRNVFGRTDAAIGTLFGLSALVMGVAQIAAPPLAERRGKINLVVLTQALSVPFLMTLALAAWVVPSERGDVTVWFLIAAAAYLCRMALMNLSSPVYQTFILERVQPETQGLAISVNRIADQVGRAFSPTLSGWFQAEYGEFGFVPVFSGASILYVLGIAVMWLFFVRGVGEQKQHRGDERSEV